MNAVEMHGIVKQYPLVRALDNVNFEVKKGEIHSILGENGAGKSTLMNVLYGMTNCDEGEILINGEKVSIRHPSQAIALGIGMVHQHFMLTPVMTVTENIIVGSEPVKGPFVDYKAAGKKSSAPGGRSRWLRRITADIQIPGRTGRRCPRPGCPWPPACQRGRRRAAAGRTSCGSHSRRSSRWP